MNPAGSTSLFTVQWYFVAVFLSSCPALCAAIWSDLVIFNVFYKSRLRWGRLRSYWATCSIVVMISHSAVVVVKYLCSFHVHERENKRQKEKWQTTPSLFFWLFFWEITSRLQPANISHCIFGYRHNFKGTFKSDVCSVYLHCTG